MLVKYWMSKNPATLDVSDSMQKAMDLMKKKNIRMLPVMRHGRLAGVVTDRDIKRASASDATSLEIHELLYLLSKIKISDIMSKPVITVNEDHTVEETAEILLEQKISGAPVVDGKGDLTGVITQSDLFRAMVLLTGLPSRGLHIAVKIEDRPGSIMEIADMIRSADGRIVSILDIVYAMRGRLAQGLFPNIPDEPQEDGSTAREHPHQSPTAVYSGSPRQPAGDLRSLTLMKSYRLVILRPCSFRRKGRYDFIPPPSPLSPWCLSCRAPGGCPALCA